MQGDMEGSRIPARHRGRVAAALRASLARVLDVALPQLCATCREPVDGAGLCPACWSKLSFIAPPYCERLGTPFPFDGGPGVVIDGSDHRSARVQSRARGRALR